MSPRSFKILGGKAGTAIAVIVLLVWSLGPIYWEPGAFANLPASHVTQLQDILLDQRIAFLADPTTGTPQSIAGFASLHISMSFTAVLAAHVIGLGRRYVLDDLGGVILGAAAVGLAMVLTPSVRRARRPGLVRDHGLELRDPAVGVGRDAA